MLTRFSSLNLLQLLIILATVQVIGAIAAFSDINELWAIYSVTQGVQVRLLNTFDSIRAEKVEVKERLKPRMKPKFKSRSTLNFF